MFHQKKYIKSLGIFEKCEKIEKFLGENHPIYALILGRIALANHGLGLFEKA